MQLRTASAGLKTTERSALDVLKKVIENFSGETKQQRFKEFCKLIAGNEEYQRAVRWYYFVNMCDQLAAAGKPDKPPAEKIQPAVSLADKVLKAVEREASVRRLKRKIVQTVLLDLILPNGKLLRDAKFEDCAKAGGWFSKVAQMGEPDQVVGEMLSEEQLRAVAPEVTA